MNKNLTVHIEIDRCSHCPNYNFSGKGGQGDWLYCDHPSVPLSLKIGDNFIPIKCPRNEKINPIIVIVNGYPTAGKDTFCEFATLEYETTEYSTVDTVKDIAVTMGWDGRKHTESRNMLSALKDFYVEWFDGSFTEMVNLINESYDEAVDQFVFLHTREPDEIKRVLEWCAEKNKKCYSVFIDRQVETTHGNHADANVSMFRYDIYIENNGSLGEFRKKSLDIFSKMVDNKI